MFKINIYIYIINWKTKKGQISVKQFMKNIKDLLDFDPSQKLKLKID